MKIAFDECVPTQMVEVFKNWSASRELIGHSIHWARDYTRVGESGDDRPWMRRFKEDGGDIIISGDKRIRSRLHEQQVYMECGYVLYMFRSTWCSWHFRDKTAFLIRWWGPIVEHAQSAPRPSCWEIPTIWEPKLESLMDKSGPFVDAFRKN